MTDIESKQRWLCLRIEFVLELKINHAIVTLLHHSRIIIPLVLGGGDKYAYYHPSAIYVLYGMRIIVLDIIGHRQISKHEN